MNRKLFLGLVCLSIQATNLLTGVSASNNRNNFSGWVGYKVTIGATDISATGLGMPLVQGTYGSHVVKIVNATTGVDIAGGSVNVTPTGSIGSFTYSNLATPITLTATTSFYIVFNTTNSGDFWYDLSGVTTQTDASIVTGVYFDTAYHETGSANSAFGIPDLQYTAVVAPPNISITSPSNGATVTGSININATATGHNLTNVAFRVDGVTIGTDTTSPYSIAWNTLSTTNGAHILTAIATDDLNQSTTSAGINVTVANATTVNFVQPVNGATIFGSSYTLIANAVTAPGTSIVNVQFKVDGVNSGGPITVVPYQTNINTTGLSEGAHTLTAVATDTSAGTGTTTINVTVNNTNPPIAIPISFDPPTNQQIIARFKVTDVNNCTCTGFTDPGMTQKVNDTNNSIFSNSEKCNKSTNIVDGNSVVCVIGKRTSDVSDIGNAGNLKDRTLSPTKAYYIQVIDGVNGAMGSGTVTTANIPWGATHPEIPPFNVAGFNRYGYPTIDFSDAGRDNDYYDPMNGMHLRRGPRNMFGTQTGQFQFATNFVISGSWTTPNNITSANISGPFASLSGGGTIFLPFKDSTDISDQLSSATILDDLGVNVYGSGTSGTADDRTVMVCMALEYGPTTNNNCTSSEIPIVLSQTTATKIIGPSTFPKYRFDGWNFPTQPDQEHLTVLGRGGYSVACTMSVCKIADGQNGGYLPTFVIPGFKIQLSDGVWRTINTVQDIQNFTLVETNVTLTGWFTLGNAGIRIRKLNSNGTISLNAGYIGATSQLPELHPNGTKDFCSPLIQSVGFEADGTTPIVPPLTGRLCIHGSGGTKFEFLLLSNMKTRFISNIQHGDASFLGIGPSYAQGTFSPTNPNQFIAIHTDDSGPLGSPDRVNRVFYSVTYDPTTCHFREWNNQYGSVNPPTDCVTWINQNSFASGRSINQQLDPYLTTHIPIWDGTYKSSVNLSGISGNYAVLFQNLSSQDNPCIVATFDIRTWTLVNAFDGLTGTLPLQRWGGCHSLGMDQADDNGNGSFNWEILSARTNVGYLSGYFKFHGPTAKCLSTDGVTCTSWSSDTSLNNGQIIASPDARCGSIPTNITTANSPLHVASCVDETNTAGLCTAGAIAGAATLGITLAPGYQCVQYRLPDDEPCNINASNYSLIPGQVDERVKFPCSYNPAWSSPSRWQVGDYISRLGADGSLDGKTESKLILTKTPFGGGFQIEVMRWSQADNRTSDFLGNPQAVLFRDHLFTGTGGSQDQTGWDGFMNSGARTWVNLSDLTSNSDTTNITASHNAIGYAPDKSHRSQVGPGAARTGDLPAMASATPQVSFNIDNIAFGGIARQSGGEVEQYPSLTNKTTPTLKWGAMSYDWRHLNPDLGSVIEDATVVWGHTTTLVAGFSHVYKIDSHGTFDQKIRRAKLFMTRSALQDISGPGSVLDDTKFWNYCIVYATNQCVTGSAVGDIYAAGLPYLGNFGCTTDTYRLSSFCATAPWSNAGWWIEQGTQESDYTGSKMRRLSMGLTGLTNQYQYTSPHMIQDGSMAIIKPGLAGGGHPDLWIAEVPAPAPFDSIDRTTYIPVTIKIGAGFAFGRVRFGYLENNNGNNTNKFHCTSYQDDCLTDNAIVPFAYDTSDSGKAGIACSSGCSITVPAISRRVMYYQTESCTGANTGCVRGAIQVVVVP